MYAAVAPDVCFTASNLPAAIAACRGNLTPLQIAVLRHFAAFNGSDSDLFQAIQRDEVPGCGPGTRTALGIMVAAPGFDDSYLHQDKWIAARARELGLPPQMVQDGSSGVGGLPRGRVFVYVASSTRGSSAPEKRPDSLQNRLLVKQEIQLMKSN
jgi:hypothetical protein